MSAAEQKSETAPGRRKGIFIGLGAVAALAAIIAALVVFAGQRVNALPNGVAMDGFDVVAYFKDGAPQHGKLEHSVDHKGKIWRFSSAENAAAFSENPDRYEPRFNGFCAYAVSGGYGAEVDFVNGWVIIDDALYLNWNEETKNAFIEEQATRVPDAARNWRLVHAGLKTNTIPFYTHAGEDVDIHHPQSID